MPHPAALSYATDCVLAAAWRYPFASYSAFIVSLRATGFSGDIKVIGPADSVDLEVRELSRVYRVDLIDVPKPTKPLVERFLWFA